MAAPPLRPDSFVELKARGRRRLLLFPFFETDDNHLSLIGDPLDKEDTLVLVHRDLANGLTTLAAAPCQNIV